VTTGAEADLSQATELARRMVCRWGMSERIAEILDTPPARMCRVGTDG